MSRHEEHLIPLYPYVKIYEEKLVPVKNFETKICIHKSNRPAIANVHILTMKLKLQNVADV